MKKDYETEEEFLANYKPSDYPRPAVTTDIAVFTAEDGDPDRLQLLMIRRGGHPCRGMFALPGGFVNPDETMDDAARRELMEETSVSPAFMTQLQTFSTPGRDPRGWTITGAYVSLVDKEKVHAVAGDDAAEAHWFDVEFSVDDENIWDIALTYQDIRLTARLQDRRRPEDIGPRLALIKSEGLAFDHGQIVAYAINRVRELLKKTEAGNC